MPIIEMGEKTVYFPDDMSEEEVQAVVDRDISRAVNIGELFKGMDTQDYLDAAAITTSPIPVVGDVAGLVADVNMYATDPESRNWFNYLFSAAGVLPFVPAPSAVRKTAEKVQKYADNSRNKKRATVKDAARVAYPGVYKDPRKIIADVEVAPESENLGKIFNTSREELADIANRQGNIDPVLPGQAVNPKGSAAAQNVTKLVIEPAAADPSEVQTAVVKCPWRVGRVDVACDGAERTQVVVDGKGLFRFRAKVGQRCAVAPVSGDGLG